MPRFTRSTAVPLACLGLMLAAVGCHKKERNTATARDSTAVAAPAPAQPAPAPAALRVTDIALGKRVGTDKHISERTDTFDPRDTIYVSVITEGTAPSAKLTARWTYQGRQLVTQSDQTIAPTGGTTATEFHIQKPSGWPKGRYTVEILLNGVSAGTRDFRVS